MARVSAATDPVLRLRSLRRLLGREDFPAVEDVSLDVLPGQVHALLGPNGAGKTTTVRVCATLLAPSAGSVHVDGVDAVRHPQQARRRLGLVLGGELGFYPRATVRDNLLFFADLQGLPSHGRRPAVTRALEQVGLDEVGDRKAGALSRGMYQRLHLARALLGTPALLLLDEPTTGLDPDVALQVRDLIRLLADQGTGVLLTSHSMPEVEELADTISVIGAGRVYTRGSVDDVAAAAGISLVSTLTAPAAAADLSQRLGQRLPEASVRQRPSSGRWSLTVSWPRGQETVSTVDTVHRRLLTALEAEGIAPPQDLLTRPASLEEAYLALADRLAR